MCADRHLHLDALGGIAGDMFVAALLDAAPELLPEATALAAQIGPGVGLDLAQASDHGLVGHQLNLTLPGKERGPRHYADYLVVLRDSAPDAGVADRACDILRRLGEAEAHVHGVTLDQVHFHEISDWDSIADILLAALLIERLAISSASVGPLPQGAGRVQTEHGLMPVPAPATAQLLRGFQLLDDGIPGERITPTGAAILAHLNPAPRLPDAMTLSATGQGFGTRRFDALPNLLRANIHQRIPDPLRDRVGVITFNIDDQTPEDLATGLDRLRARADVIEVVQIPCFGKKGRMAARIEVLCAPAALDVVAAACFQETTTIGLRHHVEERKLLPRAEGSVRIGDQHLRIKRSQRPDGTNTLKPESDDLATARSQAERERLRASAALAPNPTEPSEE